MGGAVGKSFVETGIVVSGRGDVAVVEDGGLLMGFADSDDAGVGGLSVTVVDEIPVGDSGLLVEVADESVVRAGRLLVEVADESVVGVGGIDWATGSWFVDAVMGVAACWLHPLSNKPTRALAAAIWSFCNDFIFIIPFLSEGVLKFAELRNFETNKGDLVRDVNTIIVGVLYLNSVTDHEIAERAPWFVFDDNFRISRNYKLLLGRCPIDDKCPRVQIHRLEDAAVDEQLPRRRWRRCWHRLVGGDTNRERDREDGDGEHRPHGECNIPPQVHDKHSFVTAVHPPVAGAAINIYLVGFIAVILSRCNRR